jgi:hypothetical protein
MALSVASCVDDPTPPTSAPPNTEVRAQRAPAQASADITPEAGAHPGDSRLAPSAERVGGFEIPVGARVVSSGAGGTFLDIRCQKSQILEFYEHRRYAVVQQARGYKVLSTDDNREQLAAVAPHAPPFGQGAELHLLPQAKNKWSIRVFFGATTREAPPKDAAVANPSATAVPTPSRVQASQNNASNPTRSAPARPFNPGLPDGLGQQPTRESVEQWKAANPGKRFLD